MGRISTSRLIEQTADWFVRLSRSSAQSRCSWHTASGPHLDGTATSLIAQAVPPEVKPHIEDEQPAQKGRCLVIEIPRALARQLRAVLRRSVMEGRSDWPLVLCRTEESGLTLEAGPGDVAVRYEHEGRHEPAAIAFRASVLAEFEGRNDAVSLDQVA